VLARCAVLLARLDGPGDGERGLIHEAASALNSVLPGKDTNRFAALSAEDRRAQLEQLCEVVAGITLHHQYSAKSARNCPEGGWRWGWATDCFVSHSTVTAATALVSQLRSQLERADQLAGESQVLCLSVPASSEDLAKVLCAQAAVTGRLLLVRDLSQRRTATWVSHVLFFHGAVVW
jgi:hypothetical protein